MGNGEWGTGNGERGTGNWERGTGNGEEGTGNGELKKLVLFLTTMNEACDKTHFTLFRRRSETVSQI